MSGCLEFQSSMTGSTRAGPPKPPEDSAPLLPAAPDSSSSSRSSFSGGRNSHDASENARQSPRRPDDRSRQKMTPVRPTSGPPIQLTPLWEHVVRTQRFPSEVDTRETFDEISERLRDPEWEVRQHALRVLVDVLPTLGDDAVDAAMTPVLPELVNNLGHLAPAVRKGALDTLRVYLVCSKRNEDIVRGILNEGLSRSDCLDSFQTNVTLGVILSTPSLLFPSSSSPRPSKEILREAIGALATRLVQVTHQEATIRSLAKIHEILGDEEFDSYLRELDVNARRDYDVLCEVYKVKSDDKHSAKKNGRSTAKGKKEFGNDLPKKRKDPSVERNNEINGNWECPGKTSGSSANDEKLVSIDTTMQTARIVLETEIKFNEETAITMTILEEKNEESENEDEDDESSADVVEELARDVEIILNDNEKNDRDDTRRVDEVQDSWIERRKTPRRVHFGGEIVKLRTPDSDDSEIVRTEIPQTRIPLPISPTTRMPVIRSRRSLSNPCSPNVSTTGDRKTRSVSNSPKREFYTHDATLSPKKSILSRASVSSSAARTIDDAPIVNANECKKIVDQKVDKYFGKEQNDRGWAFEICDNDNATSVEIARDKIDATRNGTTSNQEVTTAEETPPGTNNARAATTRISSSEVNENAEVEKIVLVKSAEMANSEIESFVVDAEDKHEKAESESREAIKSSKTTTTTKAEEARDTGEEVGEKLANSSEGNTESLPDSQRRRSPSRSPKKLVFETFPRMERNYILMELSSPTKTGTRKINDTKEVGSSDAQQRLAVPIDVAATRGNSPMEKSLDHTLTDPKVSNEIAKIGDEKSTRIIDKTLDDKHAKRNEVRAEDIEDNGDAGRNDRASPILNIVGDSDGKLRESNWEELGLVDQEVLNDLHNKDDWRARVRGLERVASALRTSSALIAIEPRLGSLLHAVLGGERSCRVAAAGMSVARVVVAGVSEEALKRRLPQVAWGLARQGGPNAAQLARVAMLRLRPALLLEQLLQPHCIKARNAKTRENALQLLIFSLVTFPSTEFKVENVASKVATMVFDRRRRVRQAALDTLAVLAQIYEPEEVMQAGKLAAKGQQDGDAMIAAIRARLARKSLPMVSADGLVVYGLQISPTVQIATGPDVDWIVAGSGSVSPGTGRTRGQIIATTTRQGVLEKNARNDAKKNVANSKAPNFVALGIGLNSKNDQQPFAWQLVNHPAEDDGERVRDKLWESKNRENAKSVKNNDVKSRLTGSLRHYRSATDRLDDSFEAEAAPIFLLDDKDVIMKQRKTEENFHRRMDEIYAERPGNVPATRDVTGNRLESRIPVPHSRDREIHGKETRIGASYARRRIQDGNNSQNWSAESRGSADARPRSNQRNDKLQTTINDSPRYQRPSRDNSPLRQSQTRDTYRSIYRHRRGYADGNVYREVQTAPTTTGYDVSRRRRSLKDSHGTTDGRRVGTESRVSNETRTNRRRETSDACGVPKPSLRNGDKAAVDEEDNNDINKHHFSAQTKPYRISNPNDRSSQCSARINDGPLETTSNSSSNVSGEEARPDVLQSLDDDRHSIEESFATSINENYRGSPAKSPMIEKSFDVITHESNPSRRNSIEYGISENNVDSSTVIYSTDPDNEEEETDKGSSTDDASILPRVQSSHGNFLESRKNEDEEDSSEIEDTENHRSARNVSTSFVTNGSNSSDGGISKVSDDSPASNESGEIVVETSNTATSPARIDSVYAIRSIETVEFDNSGTSMDENDGPDFTMAFVREYPKDLSNESSPRIREPSLRVDKDSSLPEFFFPVEEQRKQLEGEEEEEEEEEEVENEIGAVGNVVSVPIGSRPHSREPSLYEDASFQPLDFVGSREVIGNSALSRIVATSARPPSGRANDSPNKSNFIAISPSEISQNFHRDSSSRGKINRAASTGNENAITLSEVNGAQSVTSEKSEQPKRVATSRLSQMRQKNRTNVARVAPMIGAQSNDRNPAKSKSTTQQCFAQLESNDWEVTVKGLKALSQIARQQPEQLDSCGPGTLGRLLGRHVRNLRSQVSRAACLAAGDVFGSQARCIDQELDDIAGPLLHRTADTNKFLRADSNEALDRMVEHLTPNKTILVIVHRGASHQNAIVRAATARLLALIVDRIGPEAVMALPRDVREKFIASGAKLLMDGNLDARNHAKRIFRRLGRCEGFRKALKDSVPEATLRHIDKTLKSL